MPESIDLDFTKVLAASGFTLGEIGIYWDFDTEAEFIKTFEALILKPAQVFLLQAQNDRVVTKLTKDEVRSARSKLDLILSDPNRVARVLIKEIIEDGLEGITIKDIVEGSFKTEDELDAIIKANTPAATLEDFLVPYYAKYRKRLKKAANKKGIDEGDPKTLTLLVDRGLPDMKPTKADTNNNLLNQGTVVVLPHSPTLDQLKELQALRKLEPPK